MVPTICTLLLLLGLLLLLLLALLVVVVLLIYTESGNFLKQSVTGWTCHLWAYTFQRVAVSFMSEGWSCGRRISNIAGIEIAQVCGPLQ